MRKSRKGKKQTNLRDRFLISMIRDTLDIAAPNVYAAFGLKEPTRKGTHKQLCVIRIRNEARPKMKELYNLILDIAEEEGVNFNKKYLK